MNDEAKSLLDKIRQRSPQQGGCFIHPMMGPVGLGTPGFGALDEMLELYIAAREQEDMAKLRKELDELKLKYRDVCASKNKHWQDLEASRGEVTNLTSYHKYSCEFLLRMIRVGDIVCVQEYSQKHRRKVTAIDRETAEATFVNWDERRKDWGKTEHKEALKDFSTCGNRRVIQVERHDGKETEKARKSGVKGSKRSE